MRGDPVVAALGEVDAVAHIVERALAVVDRGVARQLGMVLEGIDAVLELVLDARPARAMAGEDGLDQLVGRVVLVRAIPAAQLAPSPVVVTTGRKGNQMPEVAMVRRTSVT